MPSQKEKLQRFELSASFELPATFSREIGRILVHWAYLEHSLQRLIWFLLEISEPEGRVAVREPRVEDRFDMIRDLADLKSVPLDKKAWAGVKKECEKVRTYRDLVAHGLWVLYPDDIWRVQQLRGQHTENVEGPPHRSRRIAPGTVLITLDGLRRTTQHIKTVIEGLIPLEKRIVERLGSSPETPL